MDNTTINKNTAPLQTQTNTKSQIRNMSSISAAPTRQPTVNAILPSKFPSPNDNARHHDPKAAQIPKRTVFLSPTSMGNLGSPPDYSKNIAEMMHAVKVQQSLKPNTTAGATTPTSFQGVNLSANISSPSSTTSEIIQHHQHIMGRFHQYEPNSTSPRHGWTGRICATNSDELTCNSTGNILHHRNGFYIIPNKRREVNLMLYERYDTSDTTF